MEPPSGIEPEAFALRERRSVLSKRNLVHWLALQYQIQYLNRGSKENSAGTSKCLFL